ncbi:MAG: ABC transporter ATP-binding protein [Planctomycetaceae bacterium]|nr:ABC transporter ATP-binding protein [Planctomycetaceae bacterium]
MTEPCVRVRDLQKRFGTVQALAGVSFDLKPGEVHGFIGPNGAGKTTAMRIIAGVDIPDSGDVLLDGKSLRDAPEQSHRRIGFMPDYLDSYPGILVWEYLDFYARVFGSARAERNRRLDDVVAFTGLGASLEQPVAGLSKGWKQRLSLARVLLNDPSVLILDEPAAGLDPRARVELRDLVVELARHGKAVFISSHILSELAEMCTAVTIIADGRVRTSGPVDALRQSVDQGRRLAIRLLRPTPDDCRRLALFLSESPHIVAVEETAVGAACSFDGDDDFKAGLLAALVAAGFTVTDFHDAASTLEEAFMAMTEKEAPHE